MALLGEEGFRRLAMLNHAKAVQLADRLQAVGLRVMTEAFFNEFVVDLGTPAAPVINKFAELGILGGVPLSRLFPSKPAVENLLLVAVTEMVSEDEMERLSLALQEIV